MPIAYIVLLALVAGNSQFPVCSTDGVVGERVFSATRNIIFSSFPLPTSHLVRCPLPLPPRLFPSSLYYSYLLLASSFGCFETPPTLWHPVIPQYRNRTVDKHGKPYGSLISVAVRRTLCILYRVWCFRTHGIAAVAILCSYTEYVVCLSIYQLANVTEAWLYCLQLCITARVAVSCRLHRTSVSPPQTHPRLLTV